MSENISVFPLTCFNREQRNKNKSRLYFKRTHLVILKTSVSHCLVLSQRSISFRCLFPIALNFSPLRWRYKVSANRQTSLPKYTASQIQTQGSVIRSFMQSNDEEMLTVSCLINGRGKGKAVPLPARGGTEGSWRLRLPDIKTLGT